MSARKRSKAKKKKAAKNQRRRSTNKKSASRLRRESNASALGKLRDWLLPNHGIFASLPLHGNTNWMPLNLVWQALCWAWSESINVTDAFDDAVDQCETMDNSALSTYQGLMNALKTWTDRLMPLLWKVVQQRMEQCGTAFYRVYGWVPIAFDGSRDSAPRTKSNEEEFCANNYGKGNTAKYRKKKSKGMRRKKNEKNKPQPQEPQVWITMLWHMGLRLPWVWRLGPSNSSERKHVEEMLEANDFPENSLFCGDAGFVGYALWAAILLKGHFLVRVGANVSLLAQSADYEIGEGGKVLCWPKNARKANLPPLELRLERVKIGKTMVWMLTSVMDESRLSNKQIVEFYKKRWGIEIEFRGLKQTLGRDKLRCRDSKRVLAELNWSIMAMTVAELFAVKEQIAKDESDGNESERYNPMKRSLAQTMRALRDALKKLSRVPKNDRDLSTRLSQAVTDSYTRKSSKKSRYRPPNPDKKPLGDPQVRKLKDEERRQWEKMAA